eukprot:scaffold299211_cov28-Tisochrysis_lutea.AAC.2
MPLPNAICAQVADPTLKRELLLVLPDLVEDGQHAAAAQTLLGILREDTRFLACVLDAFGSLVLEEDVLAEVCDALGLTAQRSQVSTRYNH